MYPKFITELSPRDQLLFDTGYSYSLLRSIKEVLETIAACEDYPVEVKEAIEAIEEFRTRRLQLRSAIYENVGAVLAVDRRLAALDKILAAAEAVPIPSHILSEDLLKALAEAKLTTSTS